jgi:hypothetical protein
MGYHILFEATQGFDQFMPNQLIQITSNLQWSLVPAMSGMESCPPALCFGLEKSP